MLTRAARTVADRIAQILTAIVKLVPEKCGRHPAAIPLFVRLVALVERCIHLGTGCQPAPRRAKSANPARPKTARPSTRASAQRLPRLPTRPGWLLKILPDDAPALAAQLAALLADPAAAELLAASPGLRRNLRPFLVMLALQSPAEPSQTGPTSTKPTPPPRLNPRPLLSCRTLRPDPPPWAPPPRAPPPGPARPLIFLQP